MYEVSTGCLDCGVQVTSLDSTSYLDLFIVTKDVPFYLYYRHGKVQFKPNREFSIKGNASKPKQSIDSEMVYTLVSMEAFLDSSVAFAIATAMEFDEAMKNITNVTVAP